MDVRYSDITLGFVAKGLGKLAIAGFGGAGKVAGLAVNAVHAVRHGNDQAAKDKALRTAFHRRFLRGGTLLPDDNEWRAVKMLGEGGQGLAGLWARVDYEKKILDRVVIKEAYPGDAFDQRPMWAWPGSYKVMSRDQAIHSILSPDPDTAKKTRDYLEEEMRKPLGKRKMPWPEDPPTLPKMAKIEEPTQAGASANPDSTAKPGSTDRTSSKENPKEGTEKSKSNEKTRPIGEGTGIVGYRYGKTNVAQASYRLYMDFCSHGDLHGLLRRYRVPKRVSARRPDGSTYLTKQVVQVPESYLWFVLYHLMLACKRMEGIEYLIKGDVIHQDIKHLNIFLDKPDEEWFPHFPIPKMGDFGSARLTNANDPGNPLEWAGVDALTLGWIPQEYRWGDHRRPRLTSSINVWQSAMVIRSLMQQEAVSVFNPFYFTKVSMDGLDKKYSKPLVRLISECLVEDPAKRRTPQVIIDLIENNKEKLFQGMSDPEISKTKKGDWVNGWDLKDEYMVGMTFKAPTDEDLPTTGFSGSGSLIDVPEK